ncbi:MAG: hypothetical protein KAU12_02670, partial [Candidatus Omnitrophica bacterium]|nr:hypothetical protein [Candidatus Omnitrophota bacterium]
MAKKISIIVIILLLLLSGSTAFAKSGIEWVFGIEKAKILADESGKKMMVFAGTEWDDLSRLLLEGPLQNKEVVRLSKKFVCLRVSMANKTFLKEIEVKQFPSVVFLETNAEGLSEVDRITGLEESGFIARTMKNVISGKNTISSLKKMTVDGSLTALPKDKQIDALTILAKAMSKRVKLYEAKKYYTRLQAIDDENKESYQQKINYIRALIYIAQKKTGDAILILEKLEGADVCFELIKCRMADNEALKVLALIDKFMDTYPEDERVSFLTESAAGYYFKAGRFKKGLDLYINLLTLYPDTSYARRARSIIDTLLAWPPRRQELFLRREREKFVIIAPDIKTYLYHISLWTDKKIYPVLIEGSRLNDKFIEAYKPAEVRRVESVILPGAVDERMLYRALYTSWTDDDLLTAITKNYGKKDIRNYFEKKNYIPLGIVLTDMKSGEMAGGLALASARTQALDFLPYTEKNKRVVGMVKMSSLKDKVNKIIKGWDYPYEGFLDGIDYITIAGDFPYAYDYHQTTSPGRYAVDDLLGRDKDNNRYAYVGRLVGGWNESVYQAMCSLFLQPKNALFFNSYANNGTWRDYRTDTASRLLSNVFEVTNIDNDKATLKRWKILTESEGNVYNLIFMNSSGGARDWNLSGSRGKVEDIPESVPAVVLYTHSTSAANPYDENTICGQWLKNGAYIYFGSVNEPYVQAFKTPNEIVGDLLFGRTFSRGLRKNS